MGSESLICLEGEGAFYGKIVIDGRMPFVCIVRLAVHTGVLI